MSTQLTELPAEFSAGTSVTYRRTLADYPATEWTLSLHLAGAGVLHKTAGKDGAVHVVALTPTETAALAPGSYQWVERVANSDSSQVLDVASGRIAVLLNVATAGTGDGQAWIERALTAVRAAISGNLTSGMASFQIDGRAVGRFSPTELYALEEKLAARVANRRGSSPIGRPVLAQFTKPGA